MRKIITILIILSMLIMPVCGMAATWGNPATETASPFAIEVSKLHVNSDVTGAKYYTVSQNEAIYGGGNVYYAIKLLLPSYTEANKYYKNCAYISGSKIKITLTFENISGKSREVVYVSLTDKAQTLWYNGKEFDAEWMASIDGYSHKHILTGTAIRNADVKVSASISGNGNLSDVKIADKYSIAHKSFYGVRPCHNCDAKNLNGYIVTGESSKYDVFFSTNAQGKVTGVYVVDKAYKTGYEGSYVKLDKTLYRWQPIGALDFCTTLGCNIAEYSMTELPTGAIYSKTGFTEAVKSDGHFFDYCKLYGIKEELRDMGRVFYEQDGNYYPMDGTESWWKSEPYFYPDSTASSGYTQYADTHFLKYNKVYHYVGAYSDVSIFQMTSAFTVYCDSIDKPYLNAANHVMGMLGFNYEDVAAGNVYMTDENILANYGYAASAHSAATWLRYGAAITTIPIAEVPATGDKSTVAILVCLSAFILAGVFVAQAEQKR